jgi:nucleoside-diphosphate-sugar epimerase
MARFLVTGGAGFIGSHLVESLLQQETSVRILDNLSTGKLAHLSTVLNNVEFQQGDVRNPADCQEAMQGIDTVIHLAALHEVPRSVENPMEAHDVNITGTLNVLWAARMAGVRRVVFSSSSAVYGECPINPRTETTMPDPASSPYAVNKLAGESYCRMFAHVYGLETVALRFFNVYGPRQDAASPYAAVIPKFIDALKASTPPTIYGDGEQSRDFVHIKDCVAAIVAACIVPGLSGHVFNIGTGRRTTINEVCTTLQHILGTNLQPYYEPVRPGDIAHDLADIDLARRFLLYEPCVSLLEGLRTLTDFNASPGPTANRKEVRNERPGMSSSIR